MLNKAGDIAELRRRLDKRRHSLARGHVNRGDAYVVAGVTENLSRHTRVVGAHIGQQDVLSYADSARDRLTDLTSSRSKVNFISPRAVEVSGASIGLAAMVNDPDGHAVLLTQR